MQDVKYFRCEIKNGKTYISARSEPQYVLGPSGWIDLHADPGEVDVNAKARENVVAFAEEPADLVSTYGSQQGLHADVILEAEVGLEDVEVYGRNEAIQAAEVAAGLKPELLREMVWVEGAEDIPGVIVLPQDDYERVYVLEGSRDNPTVRFVPEKNEAGGVRPYYEKPGDGKTYIYVDGFSGGSGTQEDPYLIHDVYELQAMKDNLNAHYALAQDIDASETVNWNSGAGFEPIGTSSSRFSGSFDGRGYKIIGLYINRGSTNNVGLFGYASGATIQNVGLVDGAIVGQNAVGSIVGTITGASATVRKCYNTSSVTGQNNIGGVASRVSGNSTTMRECYNTGSVTGKLYTGGVVSDATYGSVTDCYNTGSVTGEDRTGGVVAYVYSGSVTQCYNTGNVTGITTTGGVVGYRSGSSIIDSCYWNTETSGVSTGVGNATEPGVVGKTTTEMMQKATYVGWDFNNVWFIDEGNDYPRFRWELAPWPIPEPRELRAPGIVQTDVNIERVVPGVVQANIDRVLIAPGIVRGYIETFLIAPGILQANIDTVLSTPGILHGGIERVLAAPGIVQGDIDKTGRVLVAPGIVHGSVGKVLDVPGIVQGGIVAGLGVPGIVQGNIERVLVAPGIVGLIRMVGLFSPGIVQPDVNIERVALGVVRGGIEAVLDAPVHMDVRIRRRARAPLVVNPKIRRIRRWPMEIQALYWWRVPKPPGTFGGD